jgi:hypothetical protein
VREEKIVCDACGADITWTGNSIDWRLALKNERIPHPGGVATDMMIYPILRKGDAHVCGIKCLKAFVATL